MIDYRKEVIMTTGVLPTTTMREPCPNCNAEVVVELFNADKAAMLIGFSEGSIGGWRRWGWLRSIAVGNRYLYTLAMLEDALHLRGHSRADINLTVEQR